jgi:RND superfamily putative drug exporter
MGRWSAKHRKLAIALWLAFVLASFAVGTAVGTRELSDAQGGTGESGRAERMIEDAGFRDVDREAVVIQRHGLSSRSSRHKAVTVDVRRALQGTTGVEVIEGTRRSDDGRTVLVEFEYEGSQIEQVLGVVETLSRSHPDYYIAQFGAESAEVAIDEEIGNDFRRAELFSIPLTLIFLIAAFGALVAAAVPLFVALTAVMAALGLLSVVSQAVPADEAAGSVILLIGLAVGVDYSLFYLRREREERAAGKGVEAALDAAAATSGRAVLISGLTVLIAMAGMLVSGSREIASVGVGAMLVVAVALVGSLTVLPALLSVLGDRVERLRIPLLSGISDGEAGLWSRLLSRVMRRPALWGAAATVPLVVLSVVALQLQLAAPDVSSLPKKLSVVETYERIQSAFPAERAPAAVVLRADEAGSPALRTALERLRRLEHVQAVDLNPARTVAVVSIPLPGTGTDAASKGALARLRSETIPRALHDIRGVEVAVTGPTASLADFSGLMKRRAPLIFAFVLGLAFVLLLVAFRSIVIAAKAIVLNLLSVGAAYGLLVIVFQHGFGESLLGFESNGGVVPWLPMFLFVVLFGLSMDYHVFILSRVREAVSRGESTEDAVSRAISATAGTVTSAAAVMVAVFAIFATLTPLEMKQLGVGLAAAILIDATVVRAILLPAAMKLLGNWNWYLPRWLRWMPRVSLEGAHR